MHRPYILSQRFVIAGVYEAFDADRDASVIACMN